jgi:5-methylcytosine-specific restriction protein B
MIGHSFLTRVKDMQTLRSVLANEIIPLLQEYFYNDWQRIRLVFGDSKAPLDLQIIRQNAESALDVFGDLDEDLPEAVSFDTCPSDLISPEAIRKIYEQQA